MYSRATRAIVPSIIVFRILLNKEPDLVVIAIFTTVQNLVWEKDLI